MAWTTLAPLVRPLLTVVARLGSPRRVASFALIALLLLGGGLPLVQAAPARQEERLSDAGRTLYLPMVSRVEPTLDCRVAGTSYSTLPTYNAPDPRPDSQHADLNLALRGYAPTDTAHRGLVDYGPTPPPDAGAPQLAGLFMPARLPPFHTVYRVHDWDWGCNCRGPQIPYPGYPNLPFGVTLAGLGSMRGEPLHLPNRAGGEIDAAGYKALVIYASETRLTLKYTREDDVVQGYTLHLENVCVEPSLLALYRAANHAGRHDLPTLHAGQPIGRALGAEVGVAIRDNGTFMDPRSHRDWWR